MIGTESSTGEDSPYSLAGCPPAEPASAFPASFIVGQDLRSSKRYSANGNCRISAVSHFGAHPSRSVRHYATLYSATSSLASFFDSRAPRFPIRVHPCPSVASFVFREHNTIRHFSTPPPNDGFVFKPADSTLRDTFALVSPSPASTPRPPLPPAPARTRSRCPRASDDRWPKLRGADR